GINPEPLRGRTYPCDHYPYEQLWRVPESQTAPIDENFLKVLEEHFPVFQDGVRTVLCGYGDFIAAPRDLVLGLLDQRLASIEIGGIEQVVHGVAHHAGYGYTDLSKRFQTRVRMFPLLWFSDRDEIIHPVKELSLV